MKNKVDFSAHYLVYENMSKLAVEDQKLMHKAIEMIDAAYAPYSKFYVGAAVLTESGNIYLGCNQENASYPLCMCGERIALYNAGANEPKTPIKRLAIVAHNPTNPVNKPVSPCGACRQVIKEFQLRHNNAYPILLKGDSDEVYEIPNIDFLLPFSFDSTFL